jgi:hypothetical protein
MMTPGTRHPYMTAEKYRLSIFALIKRDDEWPDTIADLMDGFEAAIRAPLEASNEAMALELHETILAKDELFDLVAAVTAERDRLLKVAYEDARTLHYVTHIGKNGFEDFNDCDKPKCVNARAALAAPATEEVQG